MLRAAWLLPAPHCPGAFTCPGFQTEAGPWGYMASAWLYGFFCPWHRHVNLLFSLSLNANAPLCHPTRSLTCWAAFCQPRWIWTAGGVSCERGFHSGSCLIRSSLTPKCPEVLTGCVTWCVHLFCCGEMMVQLPPYSLYEVLTA